MTYCARVSSCGSHATLAHEPYCGPECERIGVAVAAVARDKGDRAHLAPDVAVAQRFAWPWLDVRVRQGAS